jgi:hypothetical protein
MSHRNKPYEDTRIAYELLSHLRSELDGLAEKKEAAEAEVQRLTAERLTVPQVTGWSTGDPLQEFAAGERVLGLVQSGSDYQLVVCTQSDDDAIPYGQIREGNGYLRYYLRDCVYWIRESDFLCAATRAAGIFLCEGK